MTDYFQPIKQKITNFFQRFSCFTWSCWNPVLQLIIIKVVLSCLAFGNSSLQRSSSMQCVLFWPIQQGDKSSAGKSSSVKSSIVKSSGIKSSGIKSSGVKSSGVKSSGVKSSGVKSSGVKSSGVCRVASSLEV